MYINIIYIYINAMTRHSKLPYISIFTSLPMNQKVLELYTTRSIKKDKMDKE